MTSVHFRRVGKLYSTHNTVKRSYSQFDEPPKLLNNSQHRRSDSTVDPIRIQDVYGHPYPAISRLSLNKTRTNDLYDAVAEGPIRISVRTPRRREENTVEAQEQYCMPCQIPCDLSHKYPIHRPDLSVRYTTDNIRPTILEVMIPIANPSDNEKLTRLPPTVMRDYPAPKNYDRNRYYLRPPK